MLTESGLGNVRLRRFRGLTGAGLVHALDPELVGVTLLEAGHAALAVGSLRREYLHPVAGEALLRLDDVSGDRRPAGGLGRFPLQIHSVHVPVLDVGAAGFSGRI